jgi:ABC-type multidrug transport system ATPase subunit
MTGDPPLVVRAARLRAARGVVVASDVAVAAAGGSVVAVEGPNGAGKSTVLAATAGLLPTDAASRRPATIGFAPERSEVLPRLSVHRWLTGLARTAGLARDSAAHQVDAVVDRMGLDAVRHRPMRELSRGNVQRALVAQALLGPPELLVLDEPVGGMDRDGVLRVTDVIAAAAADGAVVVVARHPSAPVALPAGSTWQLDQGRLTAVERGAERRAAVAWVRIRTSDGLVREVPESGVADELRDAFDAGLEVLQVERTLLSADAADAGAVGTSLTSAAPAARRVAGAVRAGAAGKVWQGALHRARLLAVSQWTTAPALLFLLVLAIVYATDAGAPAAAAGLTATALAPVLTWVAVLAHGVDGRPVARAFAAHVGGVGRAHLAASLATLPFLLAATLAGTLWPLLAQRAVAHPPAVVAQTVALLLGGGLLGVGVAALVVPPLVTGSGWRVAVTTAAYLLLLLAPVSPARPLLEVAVGQSTGAAAVLVASLVAAGAGGAAAVLAAVGARSRS